MSAESDELLDAVLIGGREERAIVIVDYDDDWPSRYEALAEVIVEAVGNGVVLLEHIGSTAVPGLAAKPIIDILLTVKDIEGEYTYLGMLEKAGLVLRVRESGHRMLRTPAKDVHLHVFSDGDPAIANYLDLRDWLRLDQEDRALYATTKKSLAQQRWTDMNYYADAKTEVITEILARARQWRQGTKVARN
ncbi:GrpB family protein [Arthrobacter sp. GMC3]|uniref:GrpB family protein n=1 Tax=Arthrobacter sp. GMC3 TaxID=2058894 RepID=UPI000CE391CC|nr:GrpB family protein [Arthrobacter sp. GMC3]